jgi:hypothetical protein
VIDNAAFENTTKANKNDIQKNKLRKLNSGVIISSASLLTSLATAYFAYQIGTAQVNAQKIQYSPVFTFRKDYEKYEGKDIYKTEYLSVENEGYPILNFKVSLDTVLTLKLTDYNKAGSDIAISLPTDYFLGQSSSSGGKGRLAFFIGNENLSLDKKMNLQIANFNKENNFKKFIIQTTNTIVKIRYTDASEETKTKYFIDEQSVDRDEYEKIHSKIEGKKQFQLENFDLKSILSTEAN